MMGKHSNTHGAAEAERAQGRKELSSHQLPSRTQVMNSLLSCPHSPTSQSDNIIWLRLQHFRCEPMYTKPAHLLSPLQASAHAVADAPLLMSSWSNSTAP